MVIPNLLTITEYDSSHLCDSFS